MTTLPRDLSRMQIADNEMHLYYRLDGIRFDVVPSITLGTLAAKPDDGTRQSFIVPNDQLQALQGRYAGTPIWRQVKPDEAGHDGAGVTISNDLHPAIRGLLSGARPDLAKRWMLTPEASRFLDRADLYEKSVQQDARAQKLLLMECREAAAERLTKMGITPSSLQIVINDLQLVTLRTDVAYLIASVSFDRLDAEAMTAYDTIEAVHALARFNHCHWAPVNVSNETECDEAAAQQVEKKKRAESTFSLGDLLRRFVQPVVPERALSNRVNSYVHIRTADHCKGKDLDVLAAFLSRRYTADYLLEPETARTTYIRDFANMRHVVTDEGVASVVSPAEDGTLPTYLQSWKENSFRNAYSPVVLLKLHEDWYLTSGRAKTFSALEDQTSDVIDLLDDIIHDCLIFRMFFRFSSVSGVSMHNSVAQAIRMHLSLDRKLDEMQSDVEAMVDRLESAQKEEETHSADKRHSETYWIGNLAGAALMGFAVFAVAKDFLPALISPGKTADESDYTAIWIAVFLAMGIATISWALGWSRRPVLPTDRRDIRRKLDAIRVLLIRS